MEKEMNLWDYASMLITRAVASEDIERDADGYPELTAILAYTVGHCNSIDEFEKARYFHQWAIEDMSMLIEQAKVKECAGYIKLFNSLNFISMLSLAIIILRKDDKA